jgi:hypothetical protein
LDTVGKLKISIGRHFNRKPTTHWSCESEQGICLIARRPDCLEELDDILKWLPNAEKPFQSATSLIQNWDKAVDYARKKPTQSQYVL